MAGKKILLVEGRDDEIVIKTLCGIRNIEENFKIEAKGGIDPLLESFPGHLKESEIECLGIIVDADTDLDARWDAFKACLIKAKYLGIPDKPEARGTILQAPMDSLSPRVGIWIMPDNQTPGILEDFLQFLVPKNSSLFQHAQDSVASIPDGDKQFSKSAEPKALIHTWLAWQKEPGKPMGQAITAKYLDSGVVQVNVLVDWLSELFS